MEMLYREGRLQVFLDEMAPEATANPSLTNHQKQRVKVVVETSAPTKTEPPKKTMLDKAGTEPIDVSELPKEKQDTGKIDLDNYLFQSEFDDNEVPTRNNPAPREEEAPQPDISPEAVQPLVYVSNGQTGDIRQRLQEFKPSRIIPYRLKFRTDYVTTQLDNGVLFDGLNSYSGVPQDFGYPPPGILLKANFKDLLEDYEFEGGVRVPTSFNGAEYFLIYNDKKKRLDKRYAVYYRRLRFTLDNTPPPIKYDNRIFLTQYQLRYPLDVFTSLRATATLRFDNSTMLSSDANTLQTPNMEEQRIGVKAEYVFDNTLDIALNVKNGTRYKVFGEMIKGLQVDLGQNNPQFKVKDGFMTVLGADFRHYQRLLKWSVLAGRLAGATSFGQQKILYMLGGTSAPRG